MAQHIVFEKQDFRSTPKQWLPLGAQVAEMANRWSGRTDLLAYVADGDAGGRSAGACYVPATAEIEINVDKAFTEGIKPFMIGDMTDRTVQFDNAKASGAIWHEAQHARYTTWSLQDAAEHFKKNEGAFRALINLEESRIEALGVKRTPENRAFMRACALEMVIGDQDKMKALSISPTRQMGHLTALTKARVDAGVLEDKDIRGVSAQIDAVLNTELQAKLRRIWQEFQRIDRPDTHRNLHRMYDLAEKYDKLIEDEAEKNGEPSAQDIADAMAKAMGEMQPGDGDGSGEGEGEGESDGTGSILDALFGDADGAAIDAQTEADGQQRKERDEAKAADAKAKSEEQGNHKAQSQKVFNKGTGPGDGNTNSRLVNKRPPTGEELVAANRISKMLDQAKYRERDRTVTASVLPPGRLRTRAVVQGAAMQEKGLNVQPEAFRQVRHKQTDEPTLSIGMMVDISGSMGSVMEPMAVTAWVMSEAARRIRARIGMVYYGQDVFATLEPGRHLDEVRTYSARDSTEKFDRAFKSIDGAVNLLYGRGARLLVVVSDGHYVTEERAAAQKWLYRCRDAGVGVLWIGLNGSYGGDAAAGYCEKANAQYIQTNGHVTDAAMQIGKAAARALENVGNRR